MMDECPECGGTGIIEIDTSGPADDRAVIETEPCDYCDGTGEVDLAAINESKRIDWAVDDRRADRDGY